MKNPSEKMSQPKTEKQPPKEETYEEYQARIRKEKELKEKIEKGGFVDYETYRNLKGTMTEEEYLEVQKEYLEQEDIKEAFRKIAESDLGIPDKELVEVFAKINKRFPTKDNMWILIETYLSLGKV